MTELSAVWGGAMIIIVGTLISLVVIFAGGILWDNWYSAYDELGYLDDAPGSSWDNMGEHALWFGNMFYTVGLFGILVSWAAGLITVYQRQRYDRYLRQI